MPNPSLAHEPEETSSPLAYAVAIALGLFLGAIGGGLLALYFGLVEFTC